MTFHLDPRGTNEDQNLGGSVMAIFALEEGPDGKRKTALETLFALFKTKTWTFLHQGKRSRCSPLLIYVRYRHSIRGWEKILLRLGEEPSLSNEATFTIT
ncbi:hypothetical protein AV530_006512 [Patagioenas fasciata monilis]|uniref:Uncharacterized protein n=1 Tax=Patagioenas fasciata monilis TaxID=372326 RepID=A0A1V4KGN9_PATFA|nr:hypothetical protein AV530_006512 [Patagioenas fasciata monilis]